MHTTTKIKNVVTTAASLVGITAAGLLALVGITIAFFVLAITLFALVGITIPEQQQTQTPRAASTPTEEPTTPPAQITPGASPYADTAALAAALPVVEELPVLESGAEIPDYERATFGPAWADVDGNGCRQRDDVLARDLIDVELASNQCTVLRGVLEVDPYTGTRIIFQHDRVAEPGNPGSQGVQGEHIISLKAAHVGGAWAWTDEQRLQFANDLDNVIAVDGAANQSKQDSGPADWLPQTSYRCTYATKYTQIATHWGLAVSAADRAALVDTLNECAVSA